MPSTPPGDLEAARTLVSHAADWAASALEQLAGCRLSVRECRVCRAGAATQAGAWEAGLFVEVQGILGGVVALLLTRDTRDVLVKTLLGTGEETPEAAESALRELGNIVASQAVSAMAAGLGGHLLPSVPTLASRNPGRALSAAQRRRGIDGDALRFEALLREPHSGLRLLLVVAPDAPFWKRAGAADRHGGV